MDTLGWMRCHGLVCLRTHPVLLCISGHGVVLASDHQGSLQHTHALIPASALLSMPRYAHLGACMGVPMVCAQMGMYAAAAGMEWKRERASQKCPAGALRPGNAALSRPVLAWPPRRLCFSGCAPVHTWMMATCSRVSGGSDGRFREGSGRTVARVEGSCCFAANPAYASMRSRDCAQRRARMRPRLRQGLRLLHVLPLVLAHTSVWGRRLERAQPFRCARTCTGAR